MCRVRKMRTGEGEKIQQTIRRGQESGQMRKWPEGIASNLDLTKQKNQQKAKNISKRKKKKTWNDEQSMCKLNVICDANGGSGRKAGTSFNDQGSGSTRLRICSRHDTRTRMKLGFRSDSRGFFFVDSCFLSDVDDIFGYCGLDQDVV